jgi:hypothetical protein
MEIFFINQFHCSIFMHVYKVHQTYSQSSPSLFTLSPPASTHSWSGLVSHSYPSFLNCILIVQRGFSVLFHPCIYRSLIRLTPSITLFFYPSCPLLFNSFQFIFVMLSSFTDTMYFNIFHLFFFTTLGFELRASNLVGKHFITWAILQP